MSPLSAPSQRQPSNAWLRLLGLLLFAEKCQSHFIRPQYTMPDRNQCRSDPSFRQSEYTGHVVAWPLKPPHCDTSEQVPTGHFVVAGVLVISRHQTNPQTDARICASPCVYCLFLLRVALEVLLES